MTGLLWYPSFCSGETSALRVITSFGNWEMHPHVSRFSTEANREILVSNESEELNRVLVLTLARAMNVTGPDVLSSFCMETLTSIQRKTPHAWTPLTLACFPPLFRDFYQQNSVPYQDTLALKRLVEAEYRKWKSQ